MPGFENLKFQGGMVGGSGEGEEGYHESDWKVSRNQLCRKVADGGKVRKVDFGPFYILAAIQGEVDAV